MAQTHKQFLAQAAKRRQAAVRLYNKGKTQQEIADKYGVKRQRVSQWLQHEAKKAG